MPEAKCPREEVPEGSPRLYHEPGEVVSKAYPTFLEEVIRSGLNVGTRMPNGKVVTLLHEGSLSAELAAILQQAMRAALAGSSQSTV